MGEGAEFRDAHLDGRLRGASAFDEFALVDPNLPRAVADFDIAAEGIHAGAGDGFEPRADDHAVDEIVELYGDAGFFLPAEFAVEDEPFVEHRTVHADAVVAGVFEFEIDVFVLVVLGTAHDAGVVVANQHAGKCLVAEGEGVEIFAGDVALFRRRTVAVMVVRACEREADAATLKCELCDGGALLHFHELNGSVGFQNGFLARAPHAADAAEQVERLLQQERAGGDFQPNAAAARFALDEIALGFELPFPRVVLGLFRGIDGGAEFFHAGLSGGFGRVLAGGDAFHHVGDFGAISFEGCGLARGFELLLIATVHGPERLVGGVGFIEQRLQFRAVHAVEDLCKCVVARLPPGRIRAGSEKRLSEFRLLRESDDLPRARRIGRRNIGRRRNFARGALCQILRAEHEGLFVRGIHLNDSGAVEMPAGFDLRDELLNALVRLRLRRGEYMVLLLGVGLLLLPILPQCRGAGIVDGLCVGLHVELREKLRGGTVVIRRHGIAQCVLHTALAILRRDAPLLELRVTVYERGIVRIAPRAHRVEAVSAAAFDGDVAVRVGVANIALVAAECIDSAQPEQCVLAVPEPVNTGPLRAAALGAALHEREALRVFEQHSDAGVPVVGLDHVVEACAGATAF